MEKHWAMVSWNGTHDMADTEFTHVVWSAKGRDAATAAARTWGEKHLSPAAVERMSVRYLGQEA